MRSRRLYPLLLCILIAGAGAGAPALADEAEELRSLRDSTIALINALVEQGVLTRQQADEIIRKAQQAGKAGAVAAAPAPGAAPVAGAAAGAAGAAAGAAGAAAAAAAPPAPGVIRVPYLPETVKQEIKEEVKQEVVSQAKEERWGVPGTWPQWLDRLTFAGDVRVRGQFDRFPNGSEPNATPEELQQPQFGAYNISNTSEPNNRLRLRVRLGVDAKVSDKVTAGLRLTTGTTGTGGDPSTENEDLGNYNVRGNVGFDRAYLTYRPSDWSYITGGRVGNPFISTTTLVWGEDLSLQGIVGGLSPRLTPSFQWLLTAGIFPTLEVQPSPLTQAKSKWLYGYQTGLNWQVAPRFNWLLAAALYDYRHAEGIPDPTIESTVYNLTAAPFRQKGNSVFDIANLANTANGTQNYVIGLASKFNELNLSTILDVTTIGTKHVLVSGDWVRNLGYSYGEILARTGVSVPDQTHGWQARVAFGDLVFDRRNSWNLWLGYRHVQSDAVIDAFTDADFHLGGTNATGYYMGGRYAYEPNSTIGFRFYTAKEISGLPLSIDVLQIDWIAAF